MRRERVLAAALLTGFASPAFGVGEGGGWTVTPMKGQTQFVFASGTPVADASYANFVASLTNLQQTQMGNGIDPFFGPESYNTQQYQYIAQSRLFIDAWHDTTSNGVYYPNNPPMNATQKSVLAITDKPGAPTPIQFAEWDYTFHHLLGQSNNGYGSNPPTTKLQAYNDLKAYYTERLNTYDGRFMSETGHSNYEPYEAEWGTQAIGMELGENIGFSQSKIAMARGASRQYGTPWMMDFSAWFQGSLTTTGPLTGGSGNARGADAGHSQSLFTRMWYNAWFSGAGMVTPEGAGNYLYQEGGAAPYTETALGVAANNFYKFTLTHDRGVPYTPLAVVLDRYSGYNGYEGKPWGILTPTAGDKQIDTLIRSQLYPGSGTNDAPSSNPEAMYLVNTPYGDMSDILLSTASATTLAKYPEILLAGDITFDPTFVASLQGALQNGSRLLVSQAQVTAMGTSNLALLQAAGTVEIQTASGLAISNSRLAQINSDHMPIAVTGSPVQYEINKNNLGWVVELINNSGVTKKPYLPAVIDPSKTASVSLQSRLTGSGYFAIDWSTNAVIPLTGNLWNLSIDPGAIRYVQIAQNQWQINAGGDWNTASNWVVQSPNGTGSVANFLGAISADATITLSSGAILSNLTFDNAHRYTLSGPGQITMAVSSGAATIDLINGSHTIGAPLAMTSNTNILGAGVLTTGNINNAASLSVQATLNAANITGVGTTSVALGDILTANQIRQSKLILNSAAQAIINPNGTNSATSRVQALSLGFGAQLNLNNNALVVDYTGASPLSTIAGQIKTGFANGSWNGFGINSSTAASNSTGAHKTALGYAEASTLGITSFAGQSVDSDAIVVRYTLSGDANLDGVVNALDLNALASNFGGTGEYWFNADFNFDGTVNTADFTAMAANFGATLPVPALGTLVPEPSVILFGVGIALAGGRIRRRR